MLGNLKTPDNSHLNDGKRKFHYFRDFSMSKRGAPKFRDLEEDFPGKYPKWRILENFQVLTKIKISKT